jgi:hypothetical protein
MSLLCKAMPLGRERWFRQSINAVGRHMYERRANLRRICRRGARQQQDQSAVCGLLALSYTSNTADRYGYRPALSVGVDVDVASGGRDADTRRLDGGGGLVDNHQNGFNRTGDLPQYVTVKTCHYGAFLMFHCCYDE